MTLPPGAAPGDPGAATAGLMAPLPNLWGMGEATLPSGDTMVVVTIADPGGLKVTFLTGDSAVDIGTKLLDVGRGVQAKNRLHLPPAAAHGLISPNGAPLRSSPAQEPGGQPEGPADPDPNERG